MTRSGPHAALLLHHLQSNQPLPPLTAVMVKIANMGLVWQERRITRRSLRRVSDETLNDIGVSRHQAETEAKRPFWEGQTHR